jgi:hypothetical protein
MWLEELAWAWLPVVGVVGLWLGRECVVMKKEIRKLVERVDRLESQTGTGKSDKRQAA